MKAKIWNWNNWISDTDPEKLEKMYKGMLIRSGFQILGELTYHFNPYGFTKIFLLGESHFAVHTFPEEQKTYIELSSCNEEKYKSFLNMQEQK